MSVSLSPSITSVGENYSFGIAETFSYIPVENFPGFIDGVMGPDLMDSMRKQAKRFGTELITDDIVEMDLKGEIKILKDGSGNTVKASATGGTGVALAGQVAVSASATVTDSGAAALAAVTALATTVASLKTLITTLTNLVLKIQKKVKA